MILILQAIRERGVDGAAKNQANISIDCTFNQGLV